MPNGTTGSAAPGSAPGGAVGEAMGSSTGSAVGEAVGFPQGSAVGEAVGSPQGSAVGETVGSAGSDSVGSAVGEAVSSSPGSSVGEAVGRRGRPRRVVAAGAAVVATVGLVTVIVIGGDDDAGVEVSTGSGVMTSEEDPGRDPESTTMDRPVTSQAEASVEAPPAVVDDGDRIRSWDFCGLLPLALAETVVGPGPTPGDPNSSGIMCWYEGAGTVSLVHEGYEPFSAATLGPDGPVEIPATAEPLAALPGGQVVWQEQQTGVDAVHVDWDADGERWALWLVTDDGNALASKDVLVAAAVAVNDAIVAQAG